MNKKINYIFLLLITLGGLMFSSCSKDDDTKTSDSDNNQNSNESNNSSTIDNSQATENSSLPNGTIKLTYYTYSGEAGAYYTYNETQKYYKGLYTCAMLENLTKQNNFIGAYLKITYNNKSIYALVTDIEPDSDGTNSIDLANDAFAELENKIVGILENATWQVVKFPTDKNISFFIKDSSNDYWISFRPFYMRYPIKKFEISYDNGKTYQEIKVTTYNQYEINIAEGGALSKKYDIKLTAIDGSTTTCSFTAQGKGIMHDGGSNF